MKETKFKVYYKGKLNGYERLTVDENEIYWEWMCLELNPEGREDWNRGVYPNYFLYQREQYIGMNDKNGKEIYTGDIMKGVIDDEEIIGDVFYDILQFNLNCNYDSEYNTLLLFDANEVGEVIGNLHENPDLLTN